MYERLGAAYHELYMHGRYMEMFRKSLEEEDSWRLRERLAILHVNLLGDCKGARDLVGSHPPADPKDYQAYWSHLLDCSSPLLGIEQEIHRKEEGIERHQRKDELEKRYSAFKAIVGESPHVLQVCQQILDCAGSSAPVLITGDTGTGKEAVARAIAEVSGRDFRPINAGTFAESLLESDLFGHVKGAFTDAKANKPGLFEMTGNVMIFLDEIGDTSPKSQVAILRVIEKGEFYRVGDPQTL
jgi:transcriptional regulator with GAF, ATPase, and Fis domain